jgi:hypothetical protein
MGAREGPAGARFSVHGFTSAVMGAVGKCAGRSAPAPAPGPGLSFGLTPVRSRSPASAAACPCWSGTVMDGAERWCAVLESV